MFKKTFSEKDNLINEIKEAREELKRVRQLFNYAEDFEIANTELTIAEMKYDNALRRAKRWTVFNPVVEIR